jgi:16S rRNA (guanine527-N7)-methyltransferase
VTSAEIERAVLDAGMSALPPDTGERFARYLALLMKWNARLNLTAIREPSEIVRRHFLESIACARLVPPVSSLLDFGSGAGFPGIPVSIVRPEIEVTLGESQAKKAAFLREVARTLGLNARVFDGRIETMDVGKRFDAVTVRAVDRMREATRAAFERVRGGGWLILFGTSSTGSPLKEALPDIDWRDPVRLTGMDDAFLLIGQKIQ